MIKSDIELRRTVAMFGSPSSLRYHIMFVLPLVLLHMPPRYLVEKMLR